MGYKIQKLKFNIECKENQIGPRIRPYFGKLIMLTFKIYFILTSFFFFYQGLLSRTLTTHRTPGEGRGPFFYSTLPLPPTHEHSDIYLQLCKWDDYHIFSIATLVFTRLLLDEIYHIIELLFDWLMWCRFSFVCLLF